MLRQVNQQGDLHGAGAQDGVSVPEEHGGAPGLEEVGFHTRNYLRASGATRTGHTPLGARESLPGRSQNKA